jgi:Prion-inhibition and propagation/CLIP1 zinc knuckle
MAEVIGVIASGITLAALFKTCIEAFEIIQTGYNQELDLRKLVLRLNIEKCRLFTWGESMGLTGAPEDAELNVSASCQFKEVVTETLETIFQLFSDSKKLQDRYGCKEYLDSPAANSHEQTSQVKFLAAAFDNFKIAASWRERRSKVLIKARWAIHDRKKFANFISEIKELVDGLQHITQPLVSLSRQGNAMKRRIENINDAETLDMVSDVCQEHHSELSRIALARAETISSASTNRWNIDHWDYRIEAVEMEEMVDLELLNITELKHQMFRMIRERRELESQLQQLRGSVLSLPIPSSPLLVVQKIAGGTLSSPTEDQRLDLVDAEENVADTAVPIQSPAWKGLEQSSSNDDHADVLCGQLTHSGQSGPSCSANVSVGLEQGHATSPGGVLPIGSKWRNMPTLSANAPTDGPTSKEDHSTPPPRGLETMHEGDSHSTVTDGSALWCESCETGGHDILNCPNMFGHHGWCEMCETGGHDILNCTNIFGHQGSANPRGNSRHTWHRLRH